MATLQSLKDKLEQADSRYNSQFAGQSRVTRELSAIDDLIATAQQVLSESTTAQGTPEVRKTVRESAQEQLDLYRGERTAIAQAQRDGGPHAVQASDLGIRANLVIHRYDRHFAGQGRSSRDISLIADMIGELRLIEGQMRTLADIRPLESLTADIAVVEGRIDQFAKEQKAIGAARIDGTQQEQAGILANVANNLFGQYRVLFAGLSRVSRRPETMVRLVAALEDVRERMATLQGQGLHDDQNDANLSLVNQRLQAWQAELTAIRAERQKTTMTTLVAELGGAANAEFEAFGQHFAGQARKTRVLKKLSDIIDRLDDGERQMTRLDEAMASDNNRANLRVVRDTLVLYLREYAAIVQAQA